MKDIKNIPFLLIPYLTICGALYHISYWETFGMNGVSILSHSNRFSIIYVLVFVLLFSFTSGKYHSENILNNHSFKYIKIIQSPTEHIMKAKNDTLKFLGSSELNLYFTNLNNSEILIIKNNNIDTLILIDKK